MNIRQEVEKAVTAFADSQNIKVAYEGTPFTKPTGSSWLEIIFLSSTVKNATVDALAARKWGTFQINCYCPDGKGMKQLDTLTEAIVALFPVADKARYETFSVEQPANVSSPLIDATYRVAAVRVQYRQEIILG